ncbi:BppU family phage baseplate upper protein [Enterococcus durans]|uniref:BppU family phage baseplate upper protein n=1 Tax=Enterococcus durans TaxID=53345 RepID=UPI001EDE1748|nr:BppU family phage baseplate upper protein [Enterococcus durans]MCG3448331.1 BppU family phage baseplate upper protein [Enterococcus durans]
MVYKTNESIIVIQAEATNPNNTDVVFWSHDRGTAKLRMKLVRKNGIPQSLPEGTTVPIRLMFRSATAEGGYGKHDYLATIEDRVNGIVSIVLEDNILGYVGIVEGSVYIVFPNDQSLDTAGRFTFDIKRSPIDDSTPELEDYYFNGFSQTIDKVEKIISDAKTEIGEKVAESETQIDAKVKDTNDKITKANQDVTTINTNIDKANDRIDQTNQQIGELGQLKRMYSNSIDFGGKGSSLSDFLDAPYYLSKVPLQENIANTAVQFPISSSKYTLYSAKMQEPFVVGNTYTITLEGTKPSTQAFRVYGQAVEDYNYGGLEPVEGLVNTWSLTFTTSKVSQDHPNLLQILQQPGATVGACTINWLKIEKGATRTPNISQFKYFGEGLKDSDNPNDYSWDITPEYAEKGLNNTVSLTEPETVLGLKNFEDGIQIAGDRVVGENEHTIYKLDKSNSNSFIDGYATFIKHGKIVIVNGTVKLKKAYPFGTTLEDVLPNEFVAKIVHGMLTGPSGTSSVSKAMYVRKDLGTIITNSEFAANEWFTFHGNYWVGEE